MFKFLKDKKKKDNDDGHVIFIDKLTDHHIQNEKKKESKGSKMILPKNNNK